MWGLAVGNRPTQNSEVNMENNKKKIAMIFPGQGSQSLGMGKELYDNHRIIQEYFERASNCLDSNFVRLCFASSERELRETVNAQTSIFLVGASIVSLLREKYNVVPDVVAGHSSGEYTAIYAAGGMTFPDALYLLKKRATFMEESTKQYPGAMLAVLGVPHDELQEICQRYDKPNDEQWVAQVVNYNSSTQLVVSGTRDALEKVVEDVKIIGGKAIFLNVSGAFHSRLMDAAAKQFAVYMVKVDFKDLSIPLLNNIEAKKVSKNEKVKESLEKQMNSPVQWWPAMQKLKSCDIIVEIGPGTAYSKMLKREWPKKEIISINSAEDIEKLLLLLGKPVARHIHGVDCDKKNCAHDDLILCGDGEHGKQETCMSCQKPDVEKEKQDTI